MQIDRETLEEVEAALEKGRQAAIVIQSIAKLDAIMDFASEILTEIKAARARLRKAMEEQDGH